MNSPERKQIFMALMRDCFADAVESAIGFRPKFDDPVDAPEHERAGNA